MIGIDIQWSFSEVPLACHCVANDKSDEGARLENLCRNLMVGTTRFHADSMLQASHWKLVGTIKILDRKNRIPAFSQSRLGIGTCQVVLYPFSEKFQKWCQKWMKLSSALEHLSLIHMAVSMGSTPPWFMAMWVGEMNENDDKPWINHGF